jgi:hypothetical protein
MKFVHALLVGVVALATTEAKWEGKKGGKWAKKKWDFDAMMVKEYTPEE